ncbi:MAG TPA: hypothetical protein VM677_34675 [Actinokineospora sp.]|nr:hypothetical protein [Actinokineospora sp.]
MPAELSGTFTVARGNSLAEFLKYGVCDGQRGVEALGFAPLPPKLVRSAVGGRRSTV